MDEPRYSVPIQVNIEHVVLADGKMSVLRSWPTSSERKQKFPPYQYQSMLGEFGTSNSNKHSVYGKGIIFSSYSPNCVNFFP